MPPDRSGGRDVYFYDAAKPTEVLGGLVLTNGITNKNFHEMLEILLVYDHPFSLRDENKTLVGKDDDPLQRGKYYITGESISLFSSAALDS